MVKSFLESLIMKKLHPKYFTFVFATLMSFLMSGLMSFTITFYQLGLSWDVMTRCFESWRFSFPLAFVAAQLVAPIVRRVTMKIVAAPT